MSQNVPPQNLEAERSVLGSILLDPEVLPNVAEVLKVEHFYSPQHALIFEAVLQLYQASKPVDLVTLTSQLKKNNKLQQVGGSAYLSELVAIVPTSAHSEEYAALVKEESTRRSLISLASKAQELAQSQEKPLEDVLDELESKLFSISQSTVKKDFSTAAELIEQHIELMEEYSRNPNALHGISTGLKALDGILGGLHKSDLLIVAARPGVGKTSFALELARYAAVDNAKSVAIFSLEMPANQLIRRILAQQSNVSLWDIRQAQLTDAAYARMAEAYDLVSRARIFVDDNPSLTVMQLRSKARKLMLEQGLDLLVIDYLQLMQGSTSKVENRVQEITEISRSLKILARELNIPVIALAQLNRSVENRTDRVPQLSDLRDSGSIEQDADVVMFLSREKQFNPESTKDTTDIFVAKHRNGAVGRVELRFIEESTKFADVV